MTFQRLEHARSAMTVRAHRKTMPSPRSVVATAGRSMGEIANDFHFEKLETLIVIEICSRFRFLPLRGCMGSKDNVQGSILNSFVTGPICCRLSEF